MAASMPSGGVPSASGNDGTGAMMIAFSLEP